MPQYDGNKIQKKSLEIHCQYTANANHIFLHFQVPRFMYLCAFSPENTPKHPAFNTELLTKMVSLFPFLNQFRGAGVTLSSEKEWCYDPTLGLATQPTTRLTNISLISLLHLSFVQSKASKFSLPTLTYRWLPYSLTITLCWCLVFWANKFSFMHSFMNKNCLLTR